MTGAQSRTETGADLKADPVAQEVKEGAKKSAAKMIADEAEPDPDKVHLTARVPVDAPADVVKDEARKGYDLMVIGLDAQRGRSMAASRPRSTSWRPDLPARCCCWPIAATRPPRLTTASRLLVPVNGSAQSRRAAEVAFALARGAGCKVHALFVSQNDGRSRTRAREESVLEGHDRTGRTLWRVGDARRFPRAARRRRPSSSEAQKNFALIVMGVSARPGDELFFGNTAAAVLKDCKVPVLFLAS